MGQNWNDDRTMTASDDSGGMCVDNVLQENWISRQFDRCLLKLLSSRLWNFVQEPRSGVGVRRLLHHVSSSPTSRATRWPLAKTFDQSVGAAQNHYHQPLPTTYDLLKNFKRADSSTVFAVIIFFVARLTFADGHGGSFLVTTCLTRYSLHMKTINIAVTPTGTNTMAIGEKIMVPCPFWWGP